MKTGIMRRAFFVFAALITLALNANAEAPVAPARWTEKQANDWYAHQPWLVGSNYIPSDAINELEMWQAESFDPKRIDQELGWAESIGMNTMRVFLHDLPWDQDAEGFRKRIDTFLAMAAKHHIRPLLVLFDSCWDANPKLGKQREPRPGVHNSGWVQSPGTVALQDPSQYPRLEKYVKGVVGAFANDKRILGWDVWNEPDNSNDGRDAPLSGQAKTALVLNLMPQVFEWSRSQHPIQPLTSGVWKGDWSADEKLSPTEKVQLELSDVITFHCYDKPEDFVKRVLSLQRLHRPIICTEYMARSNGSTFQGTLPLALKYHVGAINWGFVAGKTQTYFPWDSWQHPYIEKPPAVWFHDVFHDNGQPYDEKETQLIRQMTSEENKGKAARY